MSEEQRVESVVQAQGLFNYEERSGWQAEDQIAVEYLDACVQAANTDAFDSFKSNPKYTTILEHVLKEQGQCYLNIAREMNQDALMENIELFKELSLIHI